MRRTVLLVDDEAEIRFGIRTFLNHHGYDVAEAESWEDAQSVLGSGAALDAAILDYRLPDGDALGALPRIREPHPDLPLIILTGYGSIELAVQAIKDGADHFLTKPVQLPSLLAVLEQLIAHRRPEPADDAGDDARSPDPFLGTSARIRRLAEEARRVAAGASPVLILGETGTGKGVLARWLHASSPRHEHPFVDINSAGLSSSFLETELFGHEKGAFTGAAAAKPGLFEIADGGTLFLDEIGDVEISVQPKLLKVIEDRQFRRLGGVRDRHVDVRLIAATHHDLGKLMAQHAFRSDLYFRISTVWLTVPALRERVEDIPIIARRLLRAVAADGGRDGIALAPDAEARLSAYDWPGNVRELRNVLERALLLCDRRVLHAADLRLSAPTPSAPQPTEEHEAADVTLEDNERRHIEHVLAETDGRVSVAARRLGIPRSTLYAKLRKFQIVLSKI
jgi:DNA-binding NtrC family response regulator